MKSYYLFVVMLFTAVITSCSKDADIATGPKDTIDLNQNDSSTTTQTDSISTSPIDSLPTTSPIDSLPLTNPIDSLPTTNLSGPQEIKTYVISLFNTVGRVSTNPLKIPNNGNLPSGVSLSGVNIMITGSGTVLEDFDLDGFTVFIKADNVIIRNNRFGETAAPRNGKRLLDIKENAKNFLIEDNDFFGFKGLGGGVSSAIFQRVLTSTESGIGGIIRRNRFKHFGNDSVKSSGGILLEENVFYAASNVETTPSGVWDNNKTYNLNEVVQDTGSLKHFISLIANNKNNPLPTIGNSDANWKYFDPHYDMYTAYENTIPSVIKRNLFLRNNQDQRIPAADQSYAVGIVNAIRTIRNGGNKTNYEQLTIEENVISGQSDNFPQVPIQAADTGGVWVKPIFDNNLIDVSKNGKYTHPSTASAVDWRMNYDATTLAVIYP